MSAAVFGPPEGAKLEIVNAEGGSFLIRLTPKDRAPYVVLLNSRGDRKKQSYQLDGDWSTDAEIALVEVAPSGRAVLFRGRQLQSPLVRPVEMISVEE
jgi:hypothetical protein